MDTMTKGERSLRMALIRSKNTKPELAVRRLVHRMGFRYRLHSRKLPGKPDLVFASKMRVIFVHGCFWHLHRKCLQCRPPKSGQGYWLPKLERNSVRDKSVRRALTRLGWKSLVVWECELKQPEKLARKLFTFLSLE